MTYDSSIFTASRFQEVRREELLLTKIDTCYMNCALPLVETLNQGNFVKPFFSNIGVVFALDIILLMGDAFIGAQFDPHQ